MKNYIAGVLVTAGLYTLTAWAYKKGREDGINWCKMVLTIANNAVKSTEEKGNEG